LNEWKTSTKAYETDEVVGYLIGYFSDPKEALDVIQRLEKKLEE